MARKFKCPECNKFSVISTNTGSTKIYRCTQHKCDYYRKRDKAKEKPQKEELIQRIFPYPDRYNFLLETPEDYRDELEVEINAGILRIPLLSYEIALKDDMWPSVSAKSYKNKILSFDLERRRKPRMEVEYSDESGKKLASLVAEVPGASEKEVDIEIEDREVYIKAGSKHPYRWGAKAELKWPGTLEDMDLKNGILKVLIKSDLNERV